MESLAQSIRYACVQLDHTLLNGFAKCGYPYAISRGLFFFFFNVYVSLREREGRRGAERGEERIPNRLCTVSTEPGAGLEPPKCEIMA